MGAKANKFLLLNIAVLAIFPVASLFLNLFHDRMDIYPFYRWDMFVRSEEFLTDYSLQVETLDGKIEDQDFYSNRETYFGRFDRQIYYTVETMGIFYDDREFDEFLGHESKFISEVFFENRDVTYTLYRRKLNSIEYLKSRQFISREPIVRRHCQKNKKSVYICTDIKA